MDDALPGWLWILFTLLAAGGQTARNAMQRGLTATLGTTGATHVRFLFGLPFALLFLAITAALVPWPTLRFSLPFVAWLLLGAIAQIVATAWMLAAMRSRSFVVTTAAIKTEPVQVALFAAIFLGERVGPIALAAILVATLGVVLMSWPRRAGDDAAMNTASKSWTPVLIGVAAGGMFALSAVGFRGAILALGDSAFYIRATSTLACALLLQSLLLSGWLLWREPATLTAIARAWRPSMIAGLLGAGASQMWFLAFALEAVSRVRTLALVEVLMAQLVSRRLFSQQTSRPEGIGIGLIVLGVIVLLNS